MGSSFTPQLKKLLVAHGCRLERQGKGDHEIWFSQLVEYIGFNLSKSTLTRFQGKYVELLLPATWMAPEGLTEEEIWVWVDHIDLIYQHLWELIGREPSGEGRLKVAVVLPEKNGCGPEAWACGYLGGKGVEINDFSGDGQWLDKLLWENARADTPDGVVVHELTHNFDVYGHTDYLPDHAHAWTDFVTVYYHSYSRSGDRDESPERVEVNWLARTFEPYLADPTADRSAPACRGRRRSASAAAALKWKSPGRPPPARAAPAKRSPSLATPATSGSSTAPTSR
ncbi:MAG: hypothetical protein ACRD2T_13360 [Thermoanaerobaculia bacterium]